MICDLFQLYVFLGSWRHVFVYAFFWIVIYLKCLPNQKWRQTDWLALSSAFARHQTNPKKDFDLIFFFWREERNKFQCITTLSKKKTQHEGVQIWRVSIFEPCHYSLLSKSNWKKEHFSRCLCSMQEHCYFPIFIERETMKAM